MTEYLSIECTGNIEEKHVNQADQADQAQQMGTVMGNPMGGHYWGDDRENRRTCENYRNTSEYMPRETDHFDRLQGSQG